MAAALALSFRPDLAPATLLGAIPLLVFAPNARYGGSLTRRYVLALLIGIVPLLAWMAVLGPDGLTRLIDDLSASRAGRHLPLPGLGTVQGQLILATVVVFVFALGASIARLRADRGDWTGRVTLAIALMLLGLAPSMLQRADVAHILPVASVVIGLSPVVAYAAFGALLARGRGLAIAATGAAVVTVAVGLVHRAPPRSRARSNHSTTPGTA